MTSDPKIYKCNCGFDVPLEHYGLEAKLFCPRCQRAHTVPFTELESKEQKKGKRDRVIPIDENEIPTTPITLPDGYQSDLYSYLPPESSTAKRQQWSLVLGSMPERLGLNPVTGRLLGRLAPESVGKYYWVLRYSEKDEKAPPRYIAYSIVVREAKPLTLETMHLFPAKEGEFYQVNFECSGGLAPYLWDIAEGDVPAGLRFDQERGILFGVPFSEGIGLHRLRVRIRDSSKPAFVVQRLFLLQIKALAEFELISEEVPPMKANKPYNFEFETRGGKEPYVYRLIAGNLPSGIEFIARQGRLTGLGRPDSIGWYSVTLEVTDSQKPSQSIRRTFSLHLMPEKPLEIHGEDFPDIVAGKHLELVLGVSGGKPPFKWDMVEGLLPAGLALNRIHGRIAGSPTRESVGEYSFTIAVKDTQEPPEEFKKTFTLTIVSPSLLEIVSPPVIMDLPREDRFSYRLLADGGRPPYQWTIAEGKLPGNLSLKPKTGQIQGVPGYFQSTGVRVVVEVSDSSTEPVRATREITLFPEPLPQISSFRATLDDGSEVFVDGVLKSAAQLLDGKTGIFDERTRLKLYRGAGPLVFSFFPSIDCDMTKLKVSYILGGKPEDKPQKSATRRFSKQEEISEEKVIRINALMLELEHFEGLVKRILKFSTKELVREVKEFTGRVQGKLHIARYIKYRIQRIVPQIYPCVVNKESAETPENKYLVALLDLLSNEVNSLLGEVNEESPHFQRLSRHYGHLRSFMKAKELKGLSFYRRIERYDDPDVTRYKKASERRINKRLMGRGTGMYENLLNWFGKLSERYFDHARWHITETLGFDETFDRTLWHLWVLELLGETLSLQAESPLNRRSAQNSMEKSIYDLKTPDGPIEMWYTAKGIEGNAWRKFLGENNLSKDHIPPSCDFVCVKKSPRGVTDGLVFGLLSTEKRAESEDISAETYKLMGHLAVAKDNGIPASGMMFFRSNNGAWSRRFAESQTNGHNIMAIGVSLGEPPTPQFNMPANYMRGSEIGL